jgi:hypothetical protein
MFWMTGYVRILSVLLAGSIVVTCCYACGPASSGAVAAASEATSAPIIRHGFLGAFYRTGTKPWGAFSPYSKGRAPEPYPTPGSKLFGPSGYCDAVAANGVSLSTGYDIDKEKLANIVDLGVKWTRTGVEPFINDTSHVFDHYSWGDFDAVQCALVRNGITPTIAIDAGPVQYDAVPGQFTPKGYPIYKTSADFATWCGAVAGHEKQTFPTVSRYTLPGNEVNSNPGAFPGGEPQIAEYAKACYHALKAVQPKAFVYGFELNMDSRRDAVGFVGRLYDAGCKVGTCYDGLSIHLALHYPIPPPDAPCRDYGMQCVTDMQTAAHAPVHVLIGETAYMVPANVPNETVKATAIVAEMTTFAGNKYVDGANYANVDECDLYPSGYFVGGCIVDSLNNRLPGYAALKTLATTAYR